MDAETHTIARPVWTAERLNLLRHLAGREDKPTSRTLANLLDCKKNAIISACRRYGIKLQQKCARDVARERKLNPNLAPKPRKPRVKREPKMKPIHVADLVVPLNLSLFDLKPRQCRFAYGDGPFVFCGHSVQDDSSYCSAHHQLCYRAPDEGAKSDKIRKAA